MTTQAAKSVLNNETLAIGFDIDLMAWYAFTLEDGEVTSSTELEAGCAADAWTEALTAPAMYYNA